MNFKIFAIFIILCVIHEANSTDILGSIKTGLSSVGSSIKHAAKRAYCGIKGVITEPCHKKNSHAYEDPDYKEFNQNENYMGSTVDENGKGGSSGIDIRFTNDTMLTNATILNPTLIPPV